jgi:hypothetical protein
MHLLLQGVLCFHNGRYVALCPSEPIGTNDPPRWVSLDGSDNAAVDEASNWEDLCWNVGPRRGFVPVTLLYQINAMPFDSRTGGGGGGVGGGVGGGAVGGKGGGKGAGKGGGFKKGGRGGPPPSGRGNAAR